MKSFLFCLTFVSICNYSFSQVNYNAVSSNSILNPQKTLNNSLTIHSNGPINSPYTPPTGDHRCKTFELNQQHYQNRGVLIEFNQGYLQHAQQVSNFGIPKTSGTNEISVIFHVVHNPNNPAENVSNAAIMAVFDDLVEDYLLLNADAANARSQFGFTPADANINFCLATQDPSGNPLSEIGVVRVATNEDWYDSDNGEENKMKSSSTGGSQIWNRNNYLNVWICDISNGANSGTAGYAYRPNPTFLPSSSIDGIVLDYNLGVNNDNVLTHEVGHYLGLDHTWGGSGGCGSDDGFNDTPITDGPSFDFPGSCSGNQQTCPGTETQYENYMDYSNCTVMFTQNQADYMLSILQGIRGSLLLSPGCDPTDTPPNSAFNSLPAGPGPIILPVNGGISLIDVSTNVPTSWNWQISGNQGTDWNFMNGTNGTSQDPELEFYTVGTYDVTLTASNSFGTDATPAVELGYIQVVAPSTGTACDTLRNWDPADAEANGYYYYNPLAGGWGNIPGSTDLDGTTWYVYQYAEKFTNIGTSEVRRCQMPLFTASDPAGTGFILLKVYADDNTTVAGAPGTVLSSDTIYIADINEGSWNEFDFTNPASVTGNFFVGYEVFYGNPQDTLLVGMTSTIAGGNDAFWMDLDGNGWTDAANFGITGSIALEVMLSNGPDPVADFTFSDANVCPGGQIIANGSTSQNTTNYYWYLTDDPFTTVYEASSSASNTYSFGGAGDYAIYLFADGSCKSDGIYLPVTVNSPVSATVSAAGTTCGNNNGSITVINPTGGDGTYEYSLDGNNYTTNNVFSNLPSGTYTVHVRTQGDNCESTITATISSSTEFTATVSDNVSVCPGGSTIISASGGQTYAWFDGTTQISSSATTTVSPSTQTQYSCIVTNASGCQTTVYTTVSVNAAPIAPTITASSGTTICAGSTVDLTSSYPTNNVWSTTETSSTITVGSSGTYSVTYTDGSGCTSAPGTITINVISSPTISISSSSSPVTCGSSTGSITIGNSGTGDIVWTGTQAGTQNNVTLPYTLNNLSAGSYTVTFTNATGCQSNSVTEAISDPNPPSTPTISANGPTIFCTGNQVVLTSSYGSGNNWSNGSNSNTITVTSSGTFSVTYTDGTGCSSTSLPISVTVNANPSAPTITPGGPTVFCEGESVTLSSSQGSGNLWSDGSTSQTITVTSSGTYSVTYTNSNGCSATSSGISITSNPLPSAPVISANGSTTFCQGDSVVLTSSENSGNLWSNGSTSNSITLNNAGAFTVEYTDQNGCSNTSSTTNVTVNDLPTVDAGQDQSVCAGNSIILSGSGANSYSWDNSVTDNQSFTPSVTTTFTVTGTDANGCMNTDQVFVEVLELPTVSMNNLDSVCFGDAPISLTLGNPSGGIYSGTGVQNNIFDPNQSGIGTFQITYDYTDSNGCSGQASGDITVLVCDASLEEYLSGIEVYPNPMDEKIVMEFDGKIYAKLYDLNGKLIHEKAGFNQLVFNVSTLQSAIYYLEISTESGNLERVKLFKK